MDQSSTNPFEDESGTFHVLVNAEGQHSLWPQSTAVPAGWRAVFGPRPRAQCLDFVTRNWTDPGAGGSSGDSPAPRGRDRSS